jgi:CRP-like cAMP-binding protein
MSNISHATHADMLAHIELFAGLDRVALAGVAASLEPLPLAVGEAILRQGQVTDSLYLLVAGSLGVYSSLPGNLSETRISTIHIGECFGEMSLLTGQPHSATVRAEAESEVFQLEGARFRELHNREVSVARAVSAMLIRRLRSASDAVVQTDQVAEELLDQAFEQLPLERRERCLKASLLGDVSDRALGTLFGSDRATYRRSS